MEPGEFRLGKGPLAVTIAQVGLTHTPELDDDSGVLRSKVRKLGMPIAERRQETNVTVGNKTPVQVRSQNAWLFTNADKTVGVSSTANGFSLFTSNYQDFDQFLGRLRGVVAGILEVCDELYTTVVGLRYYNVFRVDSIPSPLLREGLSGLDVAKLKTKHYHHKYEFWCDADCDTDSSRVVLRCNSMHGDQQPRDIGHAAIVYPKRSIFDRDVTTYHLDVFANSSAGASPTPLVYEDVVDRLRSQHDYVERAFLSAVTDEALTAWDVKTK